MSEKVKQEWSELRDLIDQVSELKVSHMVEMEVENVKVQVGFKHYYDRPESPAGTRCFLFIGQDPVVIGDAFLSPADQFDRNKGRKVALTKALKASQLGKLARAQIWDVYFLAHNKIN